jgi:hypothetical protein
MLHVASSRPRDGTTFAVDEFRADFRDRKFPRLVCRFSRLGELTFLHMISRIDRFNVI